MNTLWKSWGDELRKKREAAGISQRKLAALVGVSQSAISHLEHGDNGASDELRLKLATFFKIEVNRLFPYPKLANLHTEKSQLATFTLGTLAS